MITKFDRFLNEQARSVAVGSQDVAGHIPADKRAMYRGVKVYGFKPEYIVVDPAEGGRRSANTFNYYTNWINNNEDWSDFPKREVICTTSDYTAWGFGTRYLVYPEAGARIGVCPSHDIWDCFSVKFTSKDRGITKQGVLLDTPRAVKSYYENYYTTSGSGLVLTTMHARDLCDMFMEMGISDKNYEQMVSDLGDSGMLDWFSKVFSPKGFKVVNYDELPEIGDSGMPRELWTDSKCYLELDD